jgi:hypothetical protein
MAWLSMRPDLSRARRWLAPAGFLALAALYLWPLAIQPGRVAYPPRSSYTDLLVSHLPNAAYVRNSLAAGHGLPLWNAQLFAGQPLAADPLAGLWYPPNWLLFLPIVSLAVGFNLLLWVHLAWAGLGMYTFLRSSGVGAGAAMVGAAALAGTPRLIAHLGAGHVSWVFAFAWTPWLLLAILRLGKRPTALRGATVGACLGLIFLADGRWAFYAGMLAAGYMAVSVFGGRGRAETRNLATAMAALGLVGALIAAGQAIPLAEFLRFSGRAALTLDEAAVYSLPPRYLMGLLIPDLGGLHEWMTYVGVITLLLAVLGVARRTLLWAMAAVGATAFSLGAYFFVFPVLFNLVPGLGLLRVPARAWFVVVVAVCILAAHGCERLETRIVPWLARRYQRSVAPARVTAVALVLIVLDLVRVNSTLLDVRPVPATVPAAAWLENQPGLFRVYSPSYSLPAGDRLQHLDGVNPLQLSAVVAAIDAAAGLADHGYSVLVPAFNSDDPEKAGWSAMPDARLLGRFNVKYVAAEYPVRAPMLTLIGTFGDTHVYVNEAAQERAWMRGGEAVMLSWLPDRIDLQVEGPGHLVLSEVMYPGWRAHVDGHEVPIAVEGGLFRSVQVPAGTHRVTFEYRPASVYAGAGLSLAGVATLLVLGLWQRRGARA